MSERNSQFEFKYPEIGTKVKCVVLKSSFTQIELKITEVDGFVTPVNYRAVLKGNAVNEEIYVCDKIKRNDTIDCVVVSFSDNAIVLSQL